MDIVLELMENRVNKEVYTEKRKRRREEEKKKKKKRREKGKGNREVGRKSEVLKD
ncbi:uncharacterized protein ASCRUDRAFT_75476 [Ascoidea rubescens DSM 1968]|uniref:Uncharacterized protein n=1 Tax=Ascoidea rubescens DSM 1968 TaxID=1344418 RepID=A0A1D2VJ17_9ASCO|nr:hypothetical protein ASCRUDRAFT_75476 [Ascoidea rubescens DSM 1968]ODV61467.1 hypothetical protein ASCRUDRAFT_75476 [Ascoidea rubescens DSM 1968]